MTIEEKAKEIFVAQEYMECENANDEMWMKRDAFGRGSEWMLDKAIEWLKNQGSKNNSGVIMISVDDFKKAMEEQS